MSTELWRASARELAARIGAGEVSAREVAQAHLDRIADVNPRVNAVVEVRPDEVLAAADAADAYQRTGGELGPLHGVPFTVKTNIDLAGYATTEGCETLKDFMASADAPTPQRMKQAGAVVLGRTNMPDLGLRINTESSLYGPTHNPWRQGFTAGGSSGGEGAALASGMSPLGLGNDIGGSLRNPAFCNGIASIKPSRGRIPGGNQSSPLPTPFNSQLMSVQGVMARHVADVRVGLEAVMGAHPFDPQSIDAPLAGPAYAKRAALVAQPSGGTTDPDVADGVRAAGRALEAAGWTVEEIEPPRLADVYFNWSEVMIRSLNRMRPMLESLMGEGGRSFMTLTSLDFPTNTLDDYAAMLETRFTLAREWRAFLSTYPVIVGPTWTQKPFELGFDIRGIDEAFYVVELMRFVLPANLLGLPGACVPTIERGGFAMGAQIIADAFREDIALSAAEDIERACGVLTPIDPRG